ncbi:ACP S-malonyltransferase [Cerasibacillus terrae]|uniref:Malonyl CoA-acyl carrier protein transacylase n=1 Tax=Cerasibacillus terrae TaxID=2498845 RepID=A0A5C8P2I4_9BACI|nr:ACP S-malonyltransferase [Cerasibacillus terrae]TXL67648.1 ACP S-malonyltransferase [Cerasibacillus terrae]
MRKIAFMFPGQGSQAVGMGQDFYEHYPSIQKLYQEAKEVLGKDIQEMMFHGPKEVLTETENTQPALVLASMAVFSLLKQEGVYPDMTVGHSLGEYSALVAAGSLQLHDALPLVSTRGKLMEEAYPKGQGSMAAVLGLNEEEIRDVLTGIKEEVVDIANLNCPGQVVISGTKQGVHDASILFKEKGAKRVLPLNVSGPFHSRLMKAASDTFASHLDGVPLKDAEIPVYANVTAEAVINKDEIKKLLVEQLYSPVRFEESIRSMITAGVDTFVEIGSGKVLRGLLRKIDRSVHVFSITDLASFDSFINWYKEEMPC